MKKNLFFWIMALMICAAVGCADNTIYEPEKPMLKKMSHEVTQAEARENLERIVLDLKLPSTRGGEEISLPPITSVYTTGKPAEATRSGEAEPYFHIFNFGNDEGFAIMSGDDRVEPLLALTFSGELTPETEIDNPGFKIAYSKMEDYYVYKVSSRDSGLGFDDIPPKDSIPEPILDIDTIEHNMPLGYCPVKWGQLNPYNSICCRQEQRDSIAVGCAAVALAQLMAIYKYPNDYLYYPSSETESFNWNDMTSQPPSALGIEQIDSLMYLLGKPNNLNITYGTAGEGGSSASSENVPRTLRNFGYTNGGSLINYNEERVVTELANGYPVLLRGNDPGTMGGHIWLAHGLKEIVATYSHYHILHGWITETPMKSYYILCNWGWYSKHDGYYLSNVFNTIEGPTFPDPDRSIVTTGTYNFAINIQAYINIRK